MGSYKRVAWGNHAIGYRLQHYADGPHTTQLSRLEAKCTAFEIFCMHVQLDGPND